MEPLDRLKKMIKQNDTIWTDICHVSRSGMKRIVRVFVVTDDYRIQRVGYYVSQVTVLNYDADKMGVIVKGCNFGAESKVVEDLSYALFGNTESLQQKSL